MAKNATVDGFDLPSPNDDFDINNEASLATSLVNELQKYIQDRERRYGNKLMLHDLFYTSNAQLQRKFIETLRLVKEKVDLFTVHDNAEDDGDFCPYVCLMIHLCCFAQKFMGRPHLQRVINDMLKAVLAKANQGIVNGLVNVANRWQDLYGRCLLDALGLQSESQEALADEENKFHQYLSLLKLQGLSIDKGVSISGLNFIANKLALVTNFRSYDEQELQVMNLRSGQALVAT